MSISQHIIINGMRVWLISGTYSNRFFFFCPGQTENTITELEIEMNMRIGEWTIIQEMGRELVPLYGPGYTGLRNLGNRYKPT